MLLYKGYTNETLSRARIAIKFSDVDVNDINHCKKMTECVIMVKHVLLDRSQTLEKSITLLRQTQPERPLKFGIRSCRLFWSERDNPGKQQNQKSRFEVNEAQRGVYNNMPSYFFYVQAGVRVFIQKETIVLRTTTFPSQVLVLDGFVTGERDNSAIVIARPKPMFLRI